MREREENREIPAWLLEPSGHTAEGQPRGGMHFLRRTLKNISGVMTNELYCEKYAAKDNFLQIVDPRAKLCTFLALMIFSNVAGRLSVLTVLAAIPIVYAKLSGIPVGEFFRRIWLIVPLAVFLISLPGVSSLLIKGQPLFYVIRPDGFGMRDGLYFCGDGLATAFRLALRTGISLSFAFLLFLTTRWANITAGLEAMHLPSLVVSILNMAYRYIFLLTEIAQEMMESRYLRTTGRLSSSDNRRFMAHSAAHLFLKGHQTSEEIYEAMCCRGYTGESVSLSASAFQLKDFIFIVINAAILFLLILGEHLK